MAADANDKPESIHGSTGAQTATRAGARPDDELGALRRRVAELEDEVAALQAERDKAVKARDVIIAQVLPTVASRMVPAPGRGRALSIGICVLLVLLLLLLAQLAPRLMHRVNDAPLPPGVQVRPPAAETAPPEPP